MNTFRSFLCLSLVIGNLPSAVGFAQNSPMNMNARQTKTTQLQQTVDSSSEASRRDFFATSAAMALLTAVAPNANAATGIATASDGLLPDLPSEAVRAYLQYRVQLQISADFYVFSIQDRIGDIDEWGEIGQLFRVNNNKGQGQPSKIERDFVNPMRILLLSFPPDVSEDMRDAQFRFERAANKISKATAGYRRDLPVEISPDQIATAKAGWDEGRVALNEFFVLLNKAVGLDELTLIPPAGPNQQKAYGRSARRYNELQKKIKLCQNRGGPALSQAWGQLMVSGYLQDSCGIPDMEDRKSVV